MSLTHRRLSLLAFAALLACVPLIASNDFFLDVATKTCVNAIVCLALSLFLGYAGQISLGHAAFFAIGGYGSAILTSRMGMAPLASMLAAAGIVAMVSFSLGRAILHLRGHYLAMATLGFGAIVAIVLNREIGITGGPDGMIVPPLSVMGFVFKRGVEIYAIAAITLLVFLRSAQGIVHSRMGRALRAIKDSEIAAESVGIEVSKYKTAIFTISAVFASVAGSIFAHADRFVTPAESGFLRSVEFVAMAVLGGLGSLSGAIVGAAILTIAPQLLANFDDYRDMLIGCMLVAIMVFMPEGIVPSLTSRLRELKAYLPRRGK